MTESFSQETKNEICGSHIRQKCCRKSALYGMMYGCTRFSPEQIRLDSDNPSVAMLYIKLAREFLGFRRLPDAAFLDMTAPEMTAKVSEVFSLSGDWDGLNREQLFCEFCPWSFVRGVYLTAATVTEPDASYHLEFLMRSRRTGKELSSLLEDRGLSPKLMRRNGEMVGIYFKDSESILDIFGYLGAVDAGFRMMNTKIYKDLRNNANRVTNCETANIQKTVDAANAQMNAIERIVSSELVRELPPELRETLDLRAAFPDATLLELARMHTPPITKSGVNHRLKRLVALAEKCPADRK